MTTTQTVLVVLWIAVVIAAGIDLLVTGRLNKYVDREMALHLWLITLFSGLEPIGLLLAGVTLWPAILITAGTVSIIAWRVVLRSRSRRLRARIEEEES